MFHRRNFLWAAAAVLAACGAARGEEPLRIRVLTYNIHHGAGTDGRLDLERIAEVIKRQRPDVVALQEVDNKTRRTGGVDQATELGRLTAMHAVFGKAMDYDGGEYGEAILSRWPFLKVKSHPLPRAGGGEPRAALAVRIRLKENGPECIFAGTHLDHLSADARRVQARLLVERLTEDAAPPVILAGDLNAEPDSDVMRTFSDEFTDAACNGEEPQPTAPSTNASVRIDYVLYRPAAAWRVVEVQVIDEPVASDHCPLLAVLEWTATKRREP